MNQRPFAFAPLLLASLSQAGTFLDDFSLGLRPSYYTVTTAGPGTFSLDATQGDVRMAKTNAASGFTNELVSLKLSNFGGPIAGDFTASVDFSNAVADGPNGIDQIELHTEFADGSVFYDVFSNEGASGSAHAVHVWDGSVHSFAPTNLTAGTFSISRVGSTLTGLFNGTPIFSESLTASNLTVLSFTVQNFTGNDPVSARFDNLRLTAQAVPEPTTFVALGLGAVAVLRRRRRA